MSHTPPADGPAGSSVTEAQTWQEWRVTGDHINPAWRGHVPPYLFVWSPVTTPHLCPTDQAAEHAARTFAAQVTGRSLTNVAVDYRTVVRTGWISAPERTSTP